MPTDENRHELTAVGLFAGIGGIELGFQRSKIRTQLVCEIEATAQSVLRKRLPDMALEFDVKKLRSLPQVDIVAAGFPCQNLSLAGNNKGIFGNQSGLIGEVFRLLRKARPSPRWLVLENVPFMLWHRKGHALRHLTTELEAMKYRWAYRVIDARAFGLPQRRRRVFLVASRSEDPRTVLFADDNEALRVLSSDKVPCGFSWTEGRAGLGWAVNGVPTLKGGSTIGIPSPPAIWFPTRDYLGTPDLRDAERLQGFPADWTAVEVDGEPSRIGSRWKLVGNAVSVPVSKWLGSRLVAPGDFDPMLSPSPWVRDVWPNAAWGHKGKVHPVFISEWPRRNRYVGIADFLSYPTKPLSARATEGFLLRARAGSLRFAKGFLEAAQRHLTAMEKSA